MCGTQVVPIGLRLSPPARYAAALLSRSNGRRGTVAHRAPAYVAARSAALARQVRRHEPLTALIVFGTELYHLAKVADGRTPVATYDDGTFPLIARHPDSELRLLGYPPREIARWADLQSEACARATACCVSTRWAAESMIEDYRIPAERVHVVGMGHRRRLDAPPGRDWRVPRLLFVGVDWRRKNGAGVLRAFGEFRLSHPGAALDVVGEHPPIDAPGVTCHGLLRREDPVAQSRLDALFARATMFVLPSRFDPSPIAYLEAASAGLPVIATTEGGAGELLGDAAVTVHPDDGPGLVKAMEFLGDPETARRLGAVAADRASQATWRCVAQRILTALEVPCGGEGGNPC